MSERWPDRRSDADDRVDTSSGLGAPDRADAHADLRDVPHGKDSGLPASAALAERPPSPSPPAETDPTSSGEKRRVDDDLEEAQGESGRGSDEGVHAARSTDVVEPKRPEGPPDSERIADYGPMAEGPLREDVADTFRTGTYAEVRTTEPTSLYRVYGGSARELGAYWSRAAPAGPYQAQFDLALHPSFGNEATRWVKIEVPAGTAFYEGSVGEQGGLLGGTDQAFFNDVLVQEEWIVQRGTFPEETP